MSRKRRNSSSVEADERSPIYAGEYVAEYPTKSYRPQVDNNTGQTGAFPGLEDDDGELFYGPAADGIDYLRMVRSERQGIPQLLTANRALDEPDEHDGGHYFDGTYTAPLRTDTITSPELHKAQEYYYVSLLAHFRLVRATLRCIPPLDAIQSLSSSRLISFPAQSKQAKQAWERQLSEESPHPIQIACMDFDSVLELVQLVTRKMITLFRSNDLQYIDRLGAWLWAILGKCPDRGEIGGEEISSIRSLAQRAGEVLDWLNRQDMKGGNDLYDSDEQEEIGGLSSPVHDQSQQLELDFGGNESEIARARRMKEVILEAIITVVGEVYGQRDLLELRKTWLV